MTRKHKYKKKNSPTYSYSKFDLGHKDLILTLRFDQNLINNDDLVKDC